MTDDFSSLLVAYRRGLEAQIELLRQLISRATVQREASLARDAQALTQATGERDRLMTDLLSIEEQQRLSREQLTADLARLQASEPFESMHHLHQVAQGCLADLAAIDAETRTRLEQSDTARRATAHTLEAGEATLAAYRKTLVLTSPRSSLVDRTG